MTTDVGRADDRVFQIARVPVQHTDQAFAILLDRLPLIGIRMEISLRPVFAEPEASFDLRMEVQVASIHVPPPDLHLDVGHTVFLTFLRHERESNLTTRSDVVISNGSAELALVAMELDTERADEATTAPALATLDVELGVPH